MGSSILGEKDPDKAHKPGYTFGRPSGSERRALKGLDPVRPVPGLAGSR